MPDLERAKGFQDQIRPKILLLAAGKVTKGFARFQSDEAYFPIFL